MKKDPADSGKPPIGTFLQNFGKALPQVAERCVLGCEKYEPFDWRKRDRQYFIEKLSRHWVHACEDMESIDEDGMTNISAVAFHALCLLYKIETKCDETRPEPNEDDLFREPLSFEEWAEAEEWFESGARWFSGPDCFYYRSTEGVRELYQEYVKTHSKANGGVSTGDES
jgi:hypothetical protein